MPYASTNKYRDKQAGVVADPLINATSRASMASAGPESLGDGSASSSLVPTPPAVMSAKADRFRR